MSILTAYLNSPAMAQHVLSTGDGTTPDEVKFATNQLTYAAIRWHQLFDNPAVDAKRLGMHPLKHSDFMLYMEAATNLLKKANLTEDHFRESVNDLLRAASFKAFGLSPEQALDPAVSGDYHQRLVALLTMGACEFHGCNAYFADSIREHGLNPHTKLYDAAEINGISALLQKAGSNLGLAVRDQNKIYTTTDPHHAIKHAEISPEWFYTLAAGYWQTTPEYRDQYHDAARDSVLQLPHAEQLTAAEQQQILDFFDKYWAKFATNEPPKMVIVPYFRDREQLDTQIELNLAYLQKWGPEKTVNELLHGDCYQCYEHVYDEPIDLKDAAIIDLPTAESISQQIVRSQTNAQAMAMGR